MTPSGALIVVGSGANWSGAAFRSTDDAERFAPARLPAKCPPLDDVAALDDGRIIAVGSKGTLLVSHDDGKTFKPLTHKEPALDRLQKPYQGELERVCAHQGGVVVGGSCGLLLRIS